MHGNRYLVLLEGDPIMVSSEYHWKEGDARLVAQSFRKTIVTKMRKTVDPVKLTIYESQLRSIRLEPLVMH